MLSAHPINKNRDIIEGKLRNISEIYPKANGKEKILRYSAVSTRGIKGEGSFN